MIFFWITKPTEREVQLSLLKGWVEFALIVILLLMVLFYILGRSLDLTIGWVSLSEQIIITIAAFPLIFGLRAAARAWLIDPHDANYQS